MFVLLHLQAAVVDALDAAQASHLLVNAEILDIYSTCEGQRCHSRPGEFKRKRGFANLPRAQCDQTDVVTEGALLNLVDELGQLGVCAAAVVDLKKKPHSPDTDYNHTRLIIRRIKTL